eukprot:15452366-Alexandrium_andersonii.AAC.1
MAAGRRDRPQTQAVRPSEARWDRPQTQATYQPMLRSASLLHYSTDSNPWVQTECPSELHPAAL